MEEQEYPAKYIGRILGRADDVIALSDVTRLAHHHAHEMFIDFHEAEHWKIVQIAGEIELQLKLKEGDGDPEDVFRKAKAAWKKRILECRYYCRCGRSFCYRPPDWES